jgi:hypothetical protein
VNWEAREVVTCLKGSGVDAGVNVKEEFTLYSPVGGESSLRPYASRACSDLGFGWLILGASQRAVVGGEAHRERWLRKHWEERG